MFLLLIPYAIIQGTLKRVGEESSVGSQLNAILTALGPQTTKILSQAVGEFTPMCFAAFFGGLGALLKVYILNFDDTLDGEGRVDVNKLLTKDVFLSNNFVHLGMIMGVVGFFMVQSQILVKLFYSEALPKDAELGFVGVAVSGLLFGFFSLELAGASRRLVNKRLKQAEMDYKGQQSNEIAEKKGQ